MNSHEVFRQLQSTWPETTDYLQRVGQVNNDQMTVRELTQRDRYEASLTWMDHLEVEVEDLTKRPNAASTMQRLFAVGIIVRSAMTVPEYQELRAAHDEDMQADRQDWQNNEDLPHLLETLGLRFEDSLDEALWALPELQEQMISWAQAVAKRQNYTGAPLTLSQAWILFNTVQFLDQGPAQSPGWVAECLQSALSSAFFEKAGSPQP